MPPLLNSVAVAGGSGNLGSYLVRALTAANFEVAVLTRSSPSSAADLPAGVTAKEVEYEKQETLVEALEGVNVVVGALVCPKAQTQLIEAVKEVGTVKLYVPAEFAMPTTHLTSEDHPAFYSKTQAQQLLKELEIPFLLVFCGAFTDEIFSPLYGFDFPAGQATLIGSGDTPISFTTRTDVARFLAHHLSVAYPSSSSLPSPTKPDILRIEGDRKTFAQAVELYDQTHPAAAKGKLEIKHTPLAAAEATAKDLEGDFYASLVAYCLVVAEEGGCCVADGEGRTSSGAWEGWRPKGVEEVLREME
ncbi:hypothetical protein JCM6882_002267 [Rhodosporidiobolus microsporus]